MRLADAFELVGSGTLTFVGDGPLRGAVERRPGVTVTGRVGHDEIPAWVARAHVLCQPSLIEPFGLALLEGMAAGRSVVATRVGAPPEFVPPAAGALVDPTDVEDIARGCRPRRRSPAERFSPRGRGRARPQAAGGSGGGDSPASRSRSARRRSTSGLTVSSRPASRASSRACW